MKKLTLMLVLMAGCAQLPAIKSAFDVGVELCQLYYAQHPELNFSAKDVCNIAEVNAPFIDTVLTTQGVAGDASHAALKRHMSAAK